MHLLLEGVEARTMHFRQVEEPLSSIYKELENTERYNAHRILVFTVLTMNRETKGKSL